MKKINVSLNSKKMLSMVLALFMIINVFVPSIKSDAAAKYVNMYVVSKISGDSNIRFSYNDNGLVKKINNKTLNSTRTFDYNRTKKVTSIKEKAVGSNKSWTLVYDDKGKLYRVAGKPDIWNYSYGTNNTIKMTAYVDSGIKSRRVVLDKKNRIKEMTYSYPKINNDFKHIYKYNKKGYISKCTQGVNYKKYSYKFKNNRVVKIHVFEQVAFELEYNYKVSYKKIKVPKSSVKAVKAQQKQLLQPETDYSDIYYSSDTF